MEITQAFDLEQAIAQAKKELIAAEENKAAEEAASQADKETYLAESLNLVHKLKNDLVEQGFPSQELIVFNDRYNYNLPALKISRYGVFITVSLGQTTYLGKHNITIFSPWEKQTFTVKLESIWSDKVVHTEKTNDPSRLTGWIVKALARGLFYKEENDALVRASVEVKEEVEAKIAELKRQIWTWPKGKTITLYHWTWQDGQTIEDGVKSSTFDDGWALVDELDERQYVQLMPTKYSKWNHGRLVKLIPENHLPVIDACRFCAANELPSELLDYPIKIRLPGYQDVKAFDENLEPIIIYQRDGDGILPWDGEEETKIIRPLEWVRDLVDRS
jgi:hypothetical protein